MQLNNISRKNKNTKSRQVGRGGTRGKTSGKGTKGQNARAGRKKRPEERDIIKKLPKLRGRGKNSNLSIKSKAQVVRISDIETHFSSGEIISPKTLSEKGLVTLKRGLTVKILGDGEISKKVSISMCQVSESARGKIESAGGTIS